MAKTEIDVNVAIGPDALYLITLVVIILLWKTIWCFTTKYKTLKTQNNLFLLVKTQTKCESNQSNRGGYNAKEKDLIQLSSEITISILPS